MEAKRRAYGRRDISKGGDEMTEFPNYKTLSVKKC
jgi:hypothetical protein